ncbi:hypothetical protein D3868_07705 [Azospirillum brasilense]|uniref:Uncharacterized protein n=1 Tax=Azospirillum brasilense TaxID=192 RepID=A0A0P0EZW4_AZOBR|nr:hypothetical protein AMK58_13445 [Azospirillum brasilense]OPH12275.1 hypothetical protein FE89_28930 [Azospirillum brasilense]OPH17966.1 hypothetical protein FE88_28640 [Azospirillum brasilense]PWC91001.1 hypothetical protein AEJ54_19480 [Azospirillum sp. Sp 7]QCO08929.1 hypothetical protein D3868_07705 [Azospirillum brasilense]
MVSFEQQRASVLHPSVALLCNFASANWYRDQPVEAAFEEAQLFRFSLLLQVRQSLVFNGHLAPDQLLIAVEFIAEFGPLYGLGDGTGNGVESSCLARNRSV